MYEHAVTTTLKCALVAGAGTLLAIQLAYAKCDLARDSLRELPVDIAGDAPRESPSWTEWFAATAAPPAMADPRCLLAAAAPAGVGRQSGAAAAHCAA